jgi:hypothetical protein
MILAEFRTLKVTLVAVESPFLEIPERDGGSALVSGISLAPGSFDRPVPAKASNETDRLWVAT